MFGGQASQHLATLGTPTCGEGSRKHFFAALVQLHRADGQLFATVIHDESGITYDGVGVAIVKFSLTNIVFSLAFRYISRLKVTLDAIFNGLGNPRGNFVSILTS